MELANAHPIARDRDTAMSAGPDLRIAVADPIEESEAPWQKLALCAQTDPEVFCNYSGS